MAPPLDDVNLLAALFDDSDLESIVGSPKVEAAKPLDTVLDLVYTMRFENVPLVVQSFVYEVAKMKVGTCLEVEVSADFGKAHSFDDDLGTDGRILAAEFLDSRLHRLSEWHFVLSAVDYSEATSEWVFNSKDLVQDKLLESILLGYVRNLPDEQLESDGDDACGAANCDDVKTSLDDEAGAVNCDQVKTGLDDEGGAEGGAEGGTKDDASAPSTSVQDKASEAEGLAKKRCVCDCLLLFPPPTKHGPCAH